MPSHERLAASVHRFAGPAAWISIIVGVAVLLGWIFDIQVLKSVVPGLVSMKANTALGFVFSGVALWLLREDDGPRASRVAAGGLGAVISVVAALTLAEYVFGIGLGIDHLFRDAGGHSSYPGRASPHTATAFLAVGLWIVVLARQHDGVDRVRDWLSAIACLVVLQAAIGYLYGVKFLYGINGVTGMAVHTLLTLCILCLGFLAARPRDGFIGVLSSVGAGGHVARRLTIPTLVLPLLIAYLCVKAEHLGLFGYRDGLSILAGLTVMLLGGVVVSTGRSLNRADEGRRILEQRLTDLSERDPLTNLYNRRRFEEALEQELRRSARHGTSAALILFDLDRLKHVNDSFGHAAGDELLLGVAQTLTTQLRVTDVVARLGGDEFAALLPETHREGAELAATKLVNAMRGRLWGTDAQAITSTISAGIAVTDHHSQDADTLSRAADAALYRAKAAGGNCYTLAPDRPRSVGVPRQLPTTATPSLPGTPGRAAAQTTDVGTASR